MVKKSKIAKPPSRVRYEEQHHVRSCRLDAGTDKLLTEHLDSAHCSFADFVKDALGRERSMVEARIESMASKQVDRFPEARISYLEDLVHQIIAMTINWAEYQLMCPRCKNEELISAEGREIDSKLKHPEVITWKCPECGFFINTYKRIDPKTIRFSDNEGNFIENPKKLAKNSR
jgi:hypothetical protein